jgi:hypothetical protein
MNMLVESSQYSERVRLAVTEFTTIYALAEQAYKLNQTVLTQIDDKIHNEFRYCSRGLKDFVSLSASGTATDDELIDKINKAIHAAKNAFNDAIDLVIGYAKVTIVELADIDTGKELTVYVPQLSLVMENLKNLSLKIAISRGAANNRLEIYKEIMDSDEFKRIVDFCNSIPIVKNNISTDYGRIIKQGRIFVITTSVSAVGVIFAIISAIEKFPDFAKYLSKFWPWFAIFSGS